MIARSTPSRRWATSITGVMQFVVQLAHEMIRGRPSGRLTPWTTVGTFSDFVGADRITYDAPARICLSRSSALVKRPVHSRTRSTPRSCHGRFAGSRSASAGILLPSMTSAPSAALTSRW